MSWDDYKREKKAGNSSGGLVNGSYLNLRKPGDTCRVTLLAPPEVTERQNKSGNGSHKEVRFRVLTPEADKELTLCVKIWEAGDIDELVESHSPHDFDFIVEAVQTGTDKEGRARIKLAWTPVPRTVESQAAADDFGTDEVPFG